MNLKTLSKIYLRPPGTGVHTVHTAKENRHALHQKLFNETDSDKVQDLWWQQTQEKLNQKGVHLLGICSDAGGGIQRGANWGPLFIRNQIPDELRKSYTDLGDFKINPHLLHDKYLNEETIQACRKAMFDTDDKDICVSPLSIAEHWLTAYYQESYGKIIALGGDHSVSYPLVKTWIKAKRQQGKKVAIIHFDAHTDLLDQRLGIDLCFGSWTYHILDLLESADHVYQLGIRASGKDRNFWESQLKINQYWASEFKGGQFEKVLQDIIQKLQRQKIDEVYISCDIDALSMQYASATGTPEIDGLSPHHIIQSIEKIAEKFKVTGADIVEVAPFVSHFQMREDTGAQVTLDNSLLILQKLCEVMQ